MPRSRIRFLGVLFCGLVGVSCAAGGYGVASAFPPLASEPAGGGGAGGAAAEVVPKRDGLYVTAHLLWRTLSGDFDGTNVLVGPDTIFVPEADAGSGFKIGFGGRRDNYAVELSYQQTEHDATVGGASTGDLRITMVNLDVLFFFLPEKRVQPYLLFGFGYAGADADNTSVGSAGQVGGSNLTGLAISLGGGVVYYVSSQVMLDLSLIYQYVGYSSAEGVAGDGGSIDDNVASNDVQLAFGVRFVF